MSKVSPNLLHNLSFVETSVEKLCSSSKNPTNPRTSTTTIFANFKNSLSYLINKALLLIVTYILIIKFMSKGSPIAFGAFDFIISLNMLAYKPKMLALKGSTTCRSEGLTFFVSQ
jgi:hypothetical protein